MSKQISQQEVIFRFTKMFIAQYLSSLHEIGGMQEGAVDLLAHYLIRLIKGLALQTKKIVDMQGRTLANSLHLLVVAHRLECYDFQELLKRITQYEFIPKEFDLLNNYAKKLFHKDSNTVNRCRPCLKYKNIAYIPAVFGTDLEQKCLPYRYPIEKLVAKPMEMTYQQTKTIIHRKLGSTQTLEAYNKREMKKALIGSQRRIRQINQLQSKLERKDNSLPVIITKELALQKEKQSSKTKSGKQVEVVQKREKSGDKLNKKEDKQLKKITEQYKNQLENKIDSALDEKDGKAAKNIYKDQLNKQGDDGQEKKQVGLEKEQRKQVGLENIQIKNKAVGTHQDKDCKDDKQQKDKNEEGEPEERKAQQLAKTPSRKTEISCSKNKQSQSQNECDSRQNTYNPNLRSLTLYGKEITEYGKSTYQNEPSQRIKKAKFDLISYL